MPTLIAGVVAVVVLYTLLQMFRAANPAVLARALKIVGGVVALAVAAFTGLRGELAVAIPIGIFGAGLLGWSPFGPSGFSNDLFIRRTRILVGGTLFGVLEYFVDTDYPNLFLQNVPASTTDNTTMPPTTTTTANALKNVPGMNIQDAFITWKAMGDMLKVDVGYMLPPLAQAT